MKPFFSVLFASATISAPASAQEANDSASKKSSRAELPPVTVTATRHSTSIFRVPLALTIIGKQRLENTRGYSIADALDAVPGVLAMSRYGTSDVRLVIRGFGARGAGDRSNAGTSRGVRVLLDGIPETEPDGRTSFDLIDFAAAERVEVVRSNASSLWGNAAGGVVDITTALDFENNFLRATHMGGSFDLRRTVLQAGTHLGASSLSATFTNTSQEGWRAHSDARRALLNLALASRLGAGTSAELFLSAANDLFHIPGPLTLAEVNADPNQANATYAARDERRHNRVGRLGATLSHQLASSSAVSGMVFVNPKHLQRSERGTFRDFTRQHLGGNLVFRNSTSFSQRLDGTTVIGTDGAFQGGAILFYGLTPQGTRDTALRDNKSENATNRGIFAQHEILIDDRLSLLLGARYDDISYSYRNFITPQIDASRSFHRVTPKAGVSWLLSPQHSIYANAGGGIEAPAGNETDPASTYGQDTVTALNPLLDAIRSTTYELGTKHVVGLGRAFLSYDAAGYWTEVRNEIIPYRGGRFYFTAGKVRRQGLELGATVSAPTGFQLRTSATFARNRYINYVVDSVHYGLPGAFASYAGNRVAGLPDAYYAVIASQELWGLRPLSLKASLHGVGKYFADDPNTVRVPAHTTFGVGAFLARPISLGGVELHGFVEVDNVFDRKYIGSAFTNPDVVAGVPVAFEPGAPRTVIVSLSLSRGR
ncbi:MAG: TonB-dependent receptor [Gemmatimonadales bacterium]